MFMDDLAFPWKYALSGTHQTKTPLPIDMKFRTFNNVSMITKYAKNGENWFARGDIKDKWNRVTDVKKRVQRHI